jgi:hypothetical protein
MTNMLKLEDSIEGDSMEFLNKESDIMIGRL